LIIAERELLDPHPCGQPRGPWHSVYGSYFTKRKRMDLRRERNSLRYLPPYRRICGRQCRSNDVHSLSAQQCQATDIIPVYSCCDANGCLAALGSQSAGGSFRARKEVSRNGLGRKLCEIGAVLVGKVRVHRRIYRTAWLPSLRYQSWDFGGIEVGNPSCRFARTPYPVPDRLVR